MSLKKSVRLKSSLRMSAIAMACVLAAGCASVQPVALSPQDMQAQQQKDTDLAPVLWSS